MLNFPVVLALLSSPGTIPRESIVPLRATKPQKGVAWWCWAEFEPIHQEIRGIPIKDIDSTWAAASELNLASIPKRFFAESADDDPGQREVDCSRKGDFNEDGSPDLALVGVYRTKKGLYGNFFLILTKGNQSAWRIEFKKLLPGRPSFLMIPQKGKELQVWPCLDCDAGSSISWNKISRAYRWEYPPDDGL